MRPNPKVSPAMKSAGRLKILFLFMAVLAVYFLVFYVIEHKRRSNGPWRVAFASPGNRGTPFIIINQPALKISNVRIRFPGQDAPQTNAVLILDHPREWPFDAPFGKCIFFDGLSQPGTVTFELFNHEIQLLPRVLTIDKKEHPWTPEMTIEVKP